MVIIINDYNYSEKEKKTVNNFVWLLTFLGTEGPRLKSLNLLVIFKIVGTKRYSCEKLVNLPSLAVWYLISLKIL